MQAWEGVGIQMLDYLELAPDQRTAEQEEELWTVVNALLEPEGEVRCHVDEFVRTQASLLLPATPMHRVHVHAFP